jgi:transcription elongation factor Elf1
MGAHKKATNLQEYDISCPRCGGVNSVRVTGSYEHPQSPHKWYCRCDRCERSFTLKEKQESDEVGLQDDFDRTLTKEKYLELRAQGITSDAKILQAVELPYNSFINCLTKAKENMGHTGEDEERAAGKFKNRYCIYTHAGTVSSA